MHVPSDGLAQAPLLSPCSGMQQLLVHSLFAMQPAWQEPSFVTQT